MILKALLPNKNNILVWANTIFLFVLLLGGYAEAITIVLAYFMETIIIGVFHIIKLAMVISQGKESPKDTKGMSGYGVIPFFMVHYGMFVAVQSIFVFTFFQTDYPEIESGFSLIDNYVFALGLKGMPIIITSLFVTNLGYFYTNFLAPKKYLDYSPSSIFFKPYIRIFIQQFAVIVAGFFFIILAQGTAAAILLLLFRLPVDLIMVAINKDSKAFEKYAKKRSPNYEKYKKLKQSYQEYSE